MASDNGHVLVRRAKPRLLLDVDEVLVDFQAAALRLLEKYCDRILTAEDYEVWDMFTLFTEEEKRIVTAEIEKPGYCRSLRPKEGAVAAVNELRSIVDVFAVTSHFPSPTWVYERDAQLMEEFGFKRREIVHTSAKFLVDGEFFLDDNPAHVIAWSDEHPRGCAMLWHIQNTRKLGLDDIRVRSWAEVLERVKSRLA